MGLLYSLSLSVFPQLEALIGGGDGGEASTSNSESESILESLLPVKEPIVTWKVFQIARFDIHLLAHMSLSVCLSIKIAGSRIVVYVVQDQPLFFKEDDRSPLFPTVFALWRYPALCALMIPVPSAVSQVSLSMSLPLSLYQSLLNVSDRLCFEVLM